MDASTLFSLSGDQLADKLKQAITSGKGKSSGVKETIPPMPDQSILSPSSTNPDSAISAVPDVPAPAQSSPVESKVEEKKNSEPESLQISTETENTESSSTSAPVSAVSTVPPSSASSVPIPAVSGTPTFSPMLFELAFNISKCQQLRQEYKSEAQTIQTLQKGRLGPQKQKVKSLQTEIDSKTKQVEELSERLRQLQESLSKDQENYLSAHKVLLVFEDLYNVSRSKLDTRRQSFESLQSVVREQFERLDDLSKAAMKAMQPGDFLEPLVGIDAMDIDVQENSQLPVNGSAYTTELGAIESTIINKKDTTESNGPALKIATETADFMDVDTSVEEVEQYNPSRALTPVVELPSEPEFVLLSEVTSKTLIRGVPRKETDKKSGDVVKTTLDLEIPPSPPRVLNSFDTGNLHRLVMSRDVCFFFNTHAGCRRANCRQLHECRLCGLSHSLRVCPQAGQWTLCVQHNIFKCQNENCPREHRCIACGSKSHPLRECLDVNQVSKYDFKVCLSFNSSPEPQCPLTNCGRKHQCLRCGRLEHSSMTCHMNSNNYGMVTY